MNTWNAEQPYNHLPPLPPKHDIESKAVLKQCINARAALAELKQAAELIPNQSMLINTLPTMEARASSEIENIITTTDKLFQYMQTESSRPCNQGSHAIPKRIVFRLSVTRH
jgi:Fic family protein